MGQATWTPGPLDKPGTEHLACTGVLEEGAVAIEGHFAGLRGPHADWRVPAGRQLCRPVLVDRLLSGRCIPALRMPLPEVVGAHIDAVSLTGELVKGQLAEPHKSASKRTSKGARQGAGCVAKWLLIFDGWGTQAPTCFAAPSGNCYSSAHRPRPAASGKATEDLPAMWGISITALTVRGQQVHLQPGLRPKWPKQAPR